MIENRVTSLRQLSLYSAALLTAVLACGFAALPLTARPIDVDKAVLEAQSQRVAAIKKVYPAVVAVCMDGGQGVGSGVLISPDGFALTNFHVVQPTGPLMQAGLADGLLYDAVLVGQDKVGDVALIKLLPKEKGKPFPFASLGDSDKVRIGDWSLAMGNPFSLAMDFKPTVTYGIVSGVNRYQPPEGKGLLEYTDCIQIETSINPGNSGGPLFNTQGELIGINGRGSFEKRGRVNSGVGYAISINQIKNFLGHLHAGIDTDHATLGAVVSTASEDAPLSQMIVKQVLDESDANRRGLKEGDQLLNFAGRIVTSTNQFKNILGIYPKEWRLPLTIRRGNTERHEMLVRLMGNMAAEKEQPTVPVNPPGPRPKRPPTPAPSSGITRRNAAEKYKVKKGYANWYFNELERARLLDQFKHHGDFSSLGGTWIAEGKYLKADQPGSLRLEITDGREGGDPIVNLDLNIKYSLAPLKQTDPALQREPIGSGGLMMALYHYRRLLTLGAKGFEAEFAHGGFEPFYPYPADGSVPKSLAALRVDCEVLRTRHASVECKWYFDRRGYSLRGVEAYLTRDSDPCELYFSDYKDIEGRKLPHRIEVRYGDKRYAVVTLDKYSLAKTH